MIAVCVWSWKFSNENSYEARYYVNYSFITLSLSIAMSYFYKTLFRASRPYFDDIELGDKNLIETCCGEFGNPSAHVITSTQSITSLFLYNINYVYEPYFKDNIKRQLKYYVAPFLLMAGISYSRVYTGRHSFDQVILGYILGSFNAYYGDYYYRMHLYKVNIKLDVPQDHTF